eukprot:TRINITY_DN13365_c0_g1_i2.p1 TRINITY_DN13365_c0_g1~~TRINITY_DN13365_c0_g1_i2.p1  ORF type:complete len:406 (+),score=95.48 TRINITY_DN13365_c0_g1_i2:324-1541(+)
MTVGGVGFRKSADGGLELYEDGEYRRVSEMMDTARYGYDVDGLLHLAARHPYHMRLQLQQAYISLTQGNPAAAADAIRRAAHMFAVAARGAVDVLGHSTSLPYARDSNRVCFDVLHQLSQHHLRTGCPRAALEVSKLLWKLDKTDPMHVLLHVDVMAARAGQVDWLAPAARALLETAELPSLRYGLALAEVLKGNQAGGKAALEEAVRVWPEAVPMVYGHLGRALPERVVEALAAAEVEPFLVASACLRCFEPNGATLWKTMKCGDFFLKTAEATVCADGFADTAKAAAERRNSALTEYRHYANATPDKLSCKVERLVDALNMEDERNQEWWEGQQFGVNVARDVRVRLGTVPDAVREEFARLLISQDYSMLRPLSTPLLFLLTLLPWNSLPQMLLRRLQLRHAR